MTDKEIWDLAVKAKMDELKEFESSVLVRRSVAKKTLEEETIQYWYARMQESKLHAWL